MTDHDEFQLSQYWDALTAGTPEAIDIDRSIAEPLQQVHSLFSAPKPGAARERARQRVFNVSESLPKENTMTAITLPIPLPSPNGRSHPVDVRAPQPGWLPAMSRRAFIAMAAAVLILLAGVGSYFTFVPSHDNVPAVIPAAQSTPTSDWPMYRGNPSRTGAMPGDGPRSDPTKLWRFSMDSGGFRSPVIADGVVYGGDAAGTLYAIDASTASELWRFQADGPLEITPAVFDGSVYIPSRMGTLYAIDAETGQQLWTFAEPVSEFATPTMADGTLFVGNDEGIVFSIDAISGQEKWRFETGDQTSRSQSYADGVVYVGSYDGNLYAIDATDGTEKWRTAIGPNGYGTPAVFDGVVYVPNGGKMHALDTENGSELFSFTPQDDSDVTPATVNGDLLIVAGNDGVLYGLNAKTGEQKWQSQPTGDAVQAAPALSGNTVYVASLDRHLFAFDAASGSELWSFDLDGAVDYGPSVANGVIYASTDAGSIYAVGEIGAAIAVVSPSASPETEAAAPEVGTPTADVVWQYTGGENPLNNPTGITVAPNGNIYVIDTEDNQIQILDPNGELIETVGSYGIGPGEFAFANNDYHDGSIGFDADGNSYVFDFINSRVQKFDSNHVFLQEWGTFGAENGQFNLPIGYVDAVRGRIYVADFSNNRVQVFDLGGNFLDKWGSSGALPGQFNRPDAVTVGPDGTIYVLEYGGSRVQAFDESGVNLATIGERGSAPGQINDAAGIAVDASGDIYVMDFNNSRIQIFRPDGSLVGIISSIPGLPETMLPSGIAIDPEGFLYITEEETDSVLKLHLQPLEDAQ
jgi:eukaryotic-like serine/threonine-protein kinase